MIQPAFRINFSKQIRKSKPKSVRTDFVNPSTRLVAALMDWGIVAVIAAILNAIIGWVWPGFKQFTWLLPSVVFVGCLYFASYESSEQGTTPVKKFLLIRVADFKHRSHIGFLRASLRQLGKLLPVLAVIAMLLWNSKHYRTMQRSDYRALGIFVGAYALLQLILLLPKNRRLLHDFMAGSVVLPITKVAPVVRKSGPVLKFGD